MRQPRYDYEEYGPFNPDDYDEPLDSDAEIPLYRMFLNTSNHWFNIAIEKGPYRGLIYHYRAIRPIEENGYLRIVFDYDILENPNNVIVDKETEKLMSTILNEILLNEGLPLDGKNNPKGIV